MDRFCLEQNELTNMAIVFRYFWTSEGGFYGNKHLENCEKRNKNNTFPIKLFVTVKYFSFSNVC